MTDAYQDGILAAYRTEKYAASTDCPACPFPDGTQSELAWWNGFGDATEDLIYRQNE